MIAVRPLLVGTLLIVLGGVGGYLLADGTMNPETKTLMATRMATRTVVGKDVGVPTAVERKRAQILRAAEAKDYDGLARLADPTFKYTFGGAVPGGPAAFWRQVEQRGEQPLEALAAVLELPYTLSRGIYVWPVAYDKTAAGITEYEATLLKRIPPGNTTVGPEGYLGWRAGILPDGSWVFFVAGD